MNLGDLAGALAISLLLQLLSGSYCYVAGKEGLKSIKISYLSCLRRTKGDAARKTVLSADVKTETGARRAGKVSKLH